MSICGIDRSIHSNNEARTQSYLREYLMQTDISHPLACTTSDSFPKKKQFPPTFQVSFCTAFPFATGDNNDSKDNDVCSIQGNNTPRATTGEKLPVVEHIYNTRQHGNQQSTQPQKKQEKKLKGRQSEIESLWEYASRSRASSTFGTRNSPQKSLQRRITCK
eukprot:5295838-Ditylum_brightwellii.AAC.1